MNKLVGSVLTAIGLLAATPALADEGSGSACPDLSGTFTCPAFSSQPAYELEIVSHPAGDGMLYQFFYSFLGPSANPLYASPEGGIVHGSFVAQCLEYNGTSAMVFYPIDGDPATQGTANFINADGDYQADYGGEPAIVCTRQ